jgi:hypothetical protein
MEIIFDRTTLMFTCLIINIMWLNIKLNRIMKRIG